MDNIKAKLASREYQLVDRTKSRTKSDVWEKFGVITEGCRALSFNPDRALSYA